MHMADALISPAVGSTMWAAAACLTFYSAKKLQEAPDDSRTPLMGVLGAFIFAAQMINFTIPATGSSGHLGGGMILAILLGPCAAFMTMTSVLTVQAMFFADGGLLALGCNVFNLGFFPCFIACPLIYRQIAGRRPTSRRILIGAVAASILGLQMGALGVVLETFFSGNSELPLVPFLLLMQPIHLAIGIVEGLVTAAVVTFICRARPEILGMAGMARPAGRLAMKNVLAGLLVAAALAGGMLSWFASERPDGLEWAVFHTSGKEKIESSENGLHAFFSGIQEKTAFLPDYGFMKAKADQPGAPDAPAAPENTGPSSSWPAVKAGTSVSGLLGGTMAMGLTAFIGFALKKRHRQR